MEKTIMGQRNRMFKWYGTLRWILVLWSVVLDNANAEMVSTDNDDLHFERDLQRDIGPGMLRAQLRSQSKRIMQYSLQTKTRTDIFSSPTSENGISNNASSIEETRRVITNNNPHSQTRNNGLSIRHKYSDLRKLDVSLYKVSLSREILNTTGSVRRGAKPENHSSNSPGRQPALNHVESETERSKVRRCEFPSQRDRCNDAVRPVTNSGSDVAAEKHELRTSSVQGIYNQVRHLNKRDAENDTSSRTSGPKLAPSTTQVHNSLLNLYKTTLNFTMDMTNPNDTLEAMTQCLGLLVGMFDGVADDGNAYCDTSWDRYSCWPKTLAGTIASIPCPSYLQGINDSNNATKYCHENGTWAGKAVYDLCVIGEEEPVPIDQEVDHLMAIRVIYNAGFTISTLALSIALFIFLYFRSLRCLRNDIHCHLIMTFILKNLVWIIMRHSLSTLQHDSFSGVCKMLTSIFNFTHATNFFWMFVEGLYLHVIIVWTYSADKIKLRYLVVIGWVLPAIDMIIWIVVRSELEDDHCWLPKADGVSTFDYIFIGPIMVVLFANIIFLSTIVWVLITKLRASHTLETRQYRKAVRATIILFPLLGITYVLFIIPPSDHPKVKIVFKYINAVLQSFQGLLVAVFYCFLNGEVKSVLKKKLTRFNDARTLSTKYTKTSVGWTRGGSRDYGNSVTMGNGNLIEMSKNTEHIPMKETNETDKMMVD